MLAEINYCASKLQLPAELPVSPESLRTEHISRPFITGFGGTFDTDTFSFVFFKSGVLRQIVRINRFERIPLRELQWEQSRMKSLINTNEAYQLATNWLWAISVDVPALEKKHQPSVEQTFFYPDAVLADAPPEKRERVVLLPILHVLWGTAKKPAVMVSIFGPTAELLSIHQEDESFSRRPRDLLKNVDALLAIPDGEFSRYSEEERKQLVTRFASVEYGTNSPAMFIPMKTLVPAHVPRKTPLPDAHPRAPSPVQEPNTAEAPPLSIQR